MKNPKSKVNTSHNSRIRTLYIHAGGAKTGSSAIQNFFSINAANLVNYNLDYNNSNTLRFDQEHVFGNGMYLYNSLIENNITDSDLDKILESYFTKSTNAFCSNEYFQSFDETNWQKIIDSCKRINVKLVVIFYVRNAAPFFVSVYDQVIKRHGEHRPISEWAKTWQWEHLDTLKKLIHFKNVITIKIASYDSNKSKLIENILDLIELDSGFKVTENDKERIVNRSLTEVERNILLSVNKEFSDKFCGEITDLLIYNQPNAKYNQHYDEDLVSYLATCYQKEIDWINENFFDGKPIVEVVSSNQQLLSASKKVDLNSDKTSEGIVVDWAIQKLKTQKQDVERFLLAALRKSIEKLMEDNSNFNNKSIKNLGVPSDFNGTMYLLLNPDLLIAQVDPYKHYADYGVREKRNYKITSNIEFESEYKACMESLNKLKK